ncbi:MAG: tryptophan 2,3-dioxygenase family protein [Cytophagales bacterium]|nr:tryptophan 2,3-dioxygenase family protein [Cytophagales bacterium]
MTNNFSDKVYDQIAQLASKYDTMGQDLSAYLDGLLHARYLSYPDYIQLETLLSLQRPRTEEPDELVFIIYHQITELYFKLINWEIKQIADQKNISPDAFTEKIKRLNRYWSHLISSYNIMTDGMDKAQFLKFRMSLLPASGFQSFQYRLIEIYSTSLYHLVDATVKHTYTEDTPIEVLFEQLYWKHGAIELASGNKTLTLKQFEEKYTRKLLRHSNFFKHKNLYKLVLAYSEKGILSTEMIHELKIYDYKMNVEWAMIHYRTAARFLAKKEDATPATGGTNWQKYLPPKNKRIVFFPELYTEDEINNWGH